MTKYNFLVYHAQYTDFLEKLRKLGIVHVATLKQGNDIYDSLRDKFTLQIRIEKLTNYFDSLLSNSQYPICKAKDSMNIDEGMNLLSEIEVLQKEEETLQLNLLAAERENQRMKVWGNYEPQKIQHLTNAGYTIGFFSCQARNYKKQWETEYNAFEIENSGNTTHFITVTKKPITDIDAEKFKLSNFSSQELENNVSIAQQALKTKQEEITYFASQNIENIKSLALIINDEININKVYLNTIKAADEKIMVLEGYCPEEIQNDLTTFLNEEGIYYQQSQPNDNDNVPIKLKNSWFTRLFEPLTGMYGIPSYQEWDPTPILAPFFLLFFAMCMGDSGYGLLLILFGLGVKYKKINIEMFEGMGNIITVLGIGTLLVGFFLGTAFGINMAEATYIPQYLKRLMITGEVAGFNIQMVLAVAIGVVHICLAITLKAIQYTKRFGFASNISLWGWLLLILGGLTTVLLTLAERISMEAAQIALIIIGSISALGIYVFNDPKRNPLINIGAGLWDTYNMATGLLGDVLSYIRLYALGLAGGMLGGAFNTLGLMVLGDQSNIIMWIPFIVILLLGHTLNLAMSVLGAFVHPLRLTFVEYFKNSGYEGKGEKYSPFAKTTNN